jgi:serine O-acetyltransferase
MVGAITTCRGNKIETQGDSMTVHALKTTDPRQPLFDLQRVVSGLARERQSWCEAQKRSVEPGGREFPSRDELASILADLRGVLFPMRLGPAELRQESEDYYVGHTLDRVLHALLTQVKLELRYEARHLLQTSDDEIDERAVQIVRDFSLGLPKIRALLDTDVVAAFNGDPAARSVDEVLLCYPGILAMIHHRVAHAFYQLNLPLIARIIAESAHAQTGIDIHPGATIDEGFFIDHGTGVVIGETSVIGKRVRVYQAVTLGARSFPTDAEGNPLKGLPRHPAVEDDVIIYAGATVLGRVTVGQGATIGGNLWVTHDVPAGANLTQARSRDSTQSEGSKLW